jgi:hypothetical protein
MYRIKIKIRGKLGELLTYGKGYVIHTSQGDVCVFPGPVRLPSNRQERPWQGSASSRPSG